MKKIFFLAILLLPLVAHGQTSGTIQFGGANAAAAPAYSCGTLSINFGNQGQSTTSPAFSSICTNTGNALLTITSETISTAFFTFGVGNSCTAGATLIPGTTCSMVIVFSPTSITSYTANAVLTITGATGSPQTVALSGAGVVSGGGGGPNSYTAPLFNGPAVANATYNTWTAGPVCGGNTVPAPPTENCPYLDIDYPHTSAGPAPCSSALGSCESICANVNLNALVNAWDIANGSATVAPLGGLSWFVPPATEVNVFSSDNSMIGSMEGNIGGHEYILTFNPSTLACGLKEELSASSLISPGAGSLSAQKTRAKKFNGYDVVTTSTAYPIFAEVDESVPAQTLVSMTGNSAICSATCGFTPGAKVLIAGSSVSACKGNVIVSTDSGTGFTFPSISGCTSATGGNAYPIGVVKELADLATGSFETVTPCNLPACYGNLATGTQVGGGVDTSTDVTSAGDDSTYVSCFGKPGEAQNQWSYIVGYYRPSGVFPSPTGIIWLNVKDGNIGGNGLYPGTWFGHSPGIFCTGAAGCGFSSSLINGNGLHSCTVTPDGNYALTTVQNGPGAAIWQLGTANWQLMTSCAASGHRANVGPEVVCFQAGANVSSKANEIGIANSNPTGILFKIPKVNSTGSYSPDGHDSGVAVNVTGTAGLIYWKSFQIAATGGCMNPVGQALGVVMMYTFDGTGNAYGFAHDFNNACLNGGNNSRFYYSGNDSLDGKFAIYQTNWNGDNGTDSNGNAKTLLVITQLY